ncbi:uncharacterized protein LOC109597784 [Aethina tumida]|uniref:uncharacterized protein LOC109597784 n=1 Tax=Aethina tumida TaxID=116153 RepID=UPI002147775E|nr:uncharacterized protein LOC109597784 [Aethina tumida]
MGRILRIQIFFTALQMLFLLMRWSTEGAVMAPPWANPKLNPCAKQPMGWQLLYWPPDGKCYKIFQTGYPCPEGMELSPSSDKSGNEFSAECRCPPKTAQSARDGRCYELFTIGPCEKGSYFAPDTYYNNNSSKRKWGVCKQLKTCSNPSEIYWPQDGKCYKKLTKGPCAKGQLLYSPSPDKMPACKCGKQRELREFRFDNGECYQHFTRGPCLEQGHLFLPDRSCGCHSFLPHYHEESEQCYELGSIGPCSSGEIFDLNQKTRRGSCNCKPGYIRYQSDKCYRPYTQGPCPADHILLNTTTCIRQPCEKGHLYFPADNQCFRIGTRGPCAAGKIVTFDFNTRPSVDGVSYHGVCMCERRDCRTDSNQEMCDSTKGMVRYGNGCHKLYTQGPCPKGSWMVPKRRRGREGLWSDGSNEKDGICECAPGHTRVQKTVRNRNVTICVSPTVILANYLNSNFTIAQVVTIK